MHGEILQKIGRDNIIDESIKQAIVSSQSREVENKGTYQFIKIDSENQEAVSHLVWQNDVDEAIPYQINFSFDVP